ncbi:metal dependent amidohydrolase [Xylariaceae sp. FL1651]|nr:metal dependent amidohydrolase [Xylariaceae sp. FL1651]
MGLSQSLLLLILLWVDWLRLASAECQIVKRGLSQDLLLVGTVLTSEGACRDSSVFVQSGRIAYVGDICGLGTHGRDASVLNCTGSVISPGFINTHEHIDYSTISPFPDIGERVNHRHDWRVGARNHTMRAVLVNGSDIDATAWGELRHIFSGTTSIIGGEMVPGLARNLDFADGLEDGLDGPIAIWDVFPLDDAIGILRNGDCNYGPDPIDREAVSQFHRYLAHVGEGVDAEAANEFSCLSNMSFWPKPTPSVGGRSTDIIAPNVGLVHALGLTVENYDMVAARGAKIIWSPRSNVYLYGKTLNVSDLLESGITIALGTDWLPSGSATMGREAICGASVMNESYGVNLQPKILWEMATINAAKVAGFEDHLGSLEVGKLADIAIFNNIFQERELSYDEVDPFSQAIFAPQENLELVLRGGKILLANAGITALTTGTCENITFGKSEKIVCIADELGSLFRDIETSLQGVYPVVLPGVPPDEPSCKPNR